MKNRVIAIFGVVLIIMSLLSSFVSLRSYADSIGNYFYEFWKTYYVDNAPAVKFINAVLNKSAEEKKWGYLNILRDVFQDSPLDRSSLFDVLLGMVSTSSTTDSEVKAMLGNFEDVDEFYSIIQPIVDELLTNSRYNTTINDILDYVFMGRTTGFSDDGSPQIPIENLQEELQSQNIVLGGNGMKNYSFREWIGHHADNMFNSSWGSSAFVPLFREGVSEVGTTVKQGVYILRYVYKDGKYYYSPYQYKVYVTSTVNNIIPEPAHDYTFHWDYLAVDTLSGILPDSGTNEVYTYTFEDSVSSASNTFYNMSLGYSVYAESAYWWGADRIYLSEKEGQYAYPYFPYNTSYIYWNNKPEDWSNQFFNNNYKMICDTDNTDVQLMQDLSNHLNGFNACQPVYNFENHDSQCSYDCDLGFYVSSEPIDITTKLAPSRLPTTNTTITVKGDSVYDYSITDNSTGDTTTIYTYITNNYNYPPKDETSEPETSDTETSEPSNITTSTDTSTTASGGGINIDINNKVEVNINGGNNSNYSMPDMSTVDDYLESALDDSSGFRKFMEEFFSFLPTPIITLLGILISAAIIARLMGR